MRQKNFLHPVGIVRNLLSARSRFRYLSFEAMPQPFGRSNEMNAAIEDTESPRFQDVCTVVVIYDGIASRSRAMKACDYLVRELWRDVELKFHWWRTDFLNDPTLSQMAAQNAVDSDFLILCSEGNEDLSDMIKLWFESWIGLRVNREGALVDLPSVPGSHATHGRREFFLRELSRRAGFDYLTSMPEEHFGKTLSDQPTEDISGVIDDILGESRPPSHYGLNE